MYRVYLFVLFLFAFGPLSAQAIDGNTTESNDSIKVTPKSDVRETNPAELKSHSEPIMHVEKMAVFKGGMDKLYEFVGEKVKYPRRCMEADIEGVVILQFVVEADGTLSNVRSITTHKSCPEMDAEAIRVIKMTSGKWIPGLQRNKAVRCSFRLPVRFDLG
jgi:TonB family protein